MAQLIVEVATDIAKERIQFIEVIIINRSRPHRGQYARVEVDQISQTNLAAEGVKMPLFRRVNRRHALEIVARVFTSNKLIIGSAILGTRLRDGGRSRRYGRQVVVRDDVLI